MFWETLGRPSEGGWASASGGVNRGAALCGDFTLARASCDMSCCHGCFQKELFSDTWYSMGRKASFRTELGQVTPAMGTRRREERWGAAQTQHGQVGIGSQGAVWRSVDGTFLSRSVTVRGILANPT